MNNNETQINMFDCLFENYKITKPIRLIELDDLEIIVTNDGDIFTTSKNKIRCNGRRDNRKGKKLKYAVDKDGYLRITLSNNGKRKSYYVHRLVARTFLDNYSDDEVLDELTKTYVVSKDYNTPATREQLKKMNFRKIYNNIITTHNLGSICNVHSIDLGICDLAKFTYLLTYLLILFRVKIYLWQEKRKE